MKKDNTRYPWYIKLFFWNQKRRYGQVLEPAKLWGKSPKVFAALALLYGALDRKSSPIELSLRSPIELSLRSLITIRVSQINWCKFCVDINSMMVLKRGNSEEKLNDLENYQNSGLFSEREKAALNYAEKITLSDKQVSDDDRLKLKEFFSNDDIIELTALIAFQNMSSKFNAALDVEPQGFCKTDAKSPQ